MRRELWLLRHGKSDRDMDMPDMDRPLKKRGKRAAHRMGAWMKQQGLIPDRVMSSPAERAIATAARVCEELGIGYDSILQDMRLYGSGVDSIQKLLSECDESMRVLLVGHNPEMEQFLIEMVGIVNLPFQKKLMPTAALARLEMPEDWARLEPGCAELIGITYAKSLFGEN
ncbi:MAG: SixA phosphatase family protein [Gammaproteobacteria bacterium]